jgi:hypothetical protein
VGERLIDDLARALAEPMARRRALSTIGVTLAAAVVPGVRPGAAPAARRIACFPNPCAGGRCCSTSDLTADWCCGSRGTADFYFCGSKKGECIDRCVQAGKEGGTGPWERCVTDQQERVCCPPSQECTAWRLGTSPSSKLRRGCMSRCRTIERKCGIDLQNRCCPKDQVCCGDGEFKQCCPLNHVCVKVQTDHGKYFKKCWEKCKRGEKRCGLLCCKKTRIETLPSGFKRCRCGPS